MKLKIKDIYIGKEKNYNKKSVTFVSSYEKKKSENRVYVGFLGINGDTQGDKEHHGGVDKAVCIYSENSYKFFKEKYNFKLPICAMGENITLLDCSDEDICLADRFSCGEVIFEVSQPRQPCWKISSILGIKNLTALVVKESKTGFYLRVIKEGNISKDDSFKLIERKYDKLNIAYINRCYYSAKKFQNEIKEILCCKELASAYRVALEKRVQNKEEGITDFQIDK